MATPDPGREVSLVAGGETYTLYAGNRALRLIERETGEPLLKIISGLGDTTEIDITLLTTVVWAMLQRHHPTLTIDDVDDIIDSAGGWTGIIEPMGMALERAFPDKSDEASDSGKGRSGTGKTLSQQVSKVA